MIKKYTAIILLTLASWSAVAAPHNRGGYVEGNIGTTFADINVLGTTFDTGFNTVGVNVNSGYLFNQNVGAEVGYTNYGHRLNNIDVAVKGIYPITLSDDGDMSVFGKLGIAHVFAKGYSPDTLPMIGIGASYTIAPKTDINIQMQTVSAGIVDVGLTSIGLTYYFG